MGLHSILVVLSLLTSVPAARGEDQGRSMLPHQEEPLTWRNMITNLRGCLRLCWFYFSQSDRQECLEKRKLSCSLLRMKQFIRFKLGRTVPNEGSAPNEEIVVDKVNDGVDIHKLSPLKKLQYAGNRVIQENKLLGELHNAEE